MIDELPIKIMYRISFCEMDNIEIEELKMTKETIKRYYFNNTNYGFLEKKNLNVKPDPEKPLSSSNAIYSFSKNEAIRIAIEYLEKRNLYLKNIIYSNRENISLLNKSLQK